MPSGAKRALGPGDGIITGEVHWDAIAAGVVVMLVGQLLLTLLAAALAGLTIDTTRAPSEATVAWIAFAWWAIAGIASAFAGAWTAGWSAGSKAGTDRTEGAFQGFLTWAVTTLLISVVVLGLASGSAVATRLGGPMAFEVPRVEQGIAVSEQTAQAAATASLAAFVALLAASVAAMGGGYFGVAHAKRTLIDAGVVTKAEDVASTKRTAKA